MIDYDFGSHECDVCGLILEEDEVHTVVDFYGEGEDGSFCYEHYSQMGFDDDDEYYEDYEETEDIESWIESSVDMSEPSTVLSLFKVVSGEGNDYTWAAYSGEGNTFVKGYQGIYLRLDSDEKREKFLACLRERLSN